MKRFVQRPHQIPKITDRAWGVNVHAALGKLLDDAMARPHELRNPARWVAVYDSIDEPAHENPPGWLKTLRTHVQSTLDECMPVLIHEPSHPGYLHELLRAYRRVTTTLQRVCRS